MRAFSRFVLFCFIVALFKNEKDIADYYIKKIEEELLQHTESGVKNFAVSSLDLVPLTFQCTGAAFRCSNRSSLLAFTAFRDDTTNQ